jgi:hypothetical protein
MYTEFFFAAEVDEEAYNALRLFDEWIESSPLDDRLAEHPFFGLPRAGQLLYGWSAYSSGVAVPLALEKETYSRALHQVTIRSSLKNYSGEVDAFLEWVTPHVVGEACGTGGFVGYSLYEIFAVPTLYFVRNGQLFESDGGEVVER